MMRGIWPILAVNLKRAWGRKAYVLTSIGLIFVSVLGAVVAGARFEPKPNIAWMSSADNFAADTAAIPPRLRPLGGYYQIEPVAAIPTLSQLVRNRFDAAVLDHGDGRIDIISIRSDAFRQQLEQAFRQPNGFHPDTSNRRRIGTQIVGYLTMFVFLAGTSFMMFFADDKKNKALHRTITAPVHVHVYLAAHWVFSAMINFCSVLSLLILLRSGFGIQIGLTYRQFALVIGLLSIVAASFGLFLTAVVEHADNSAALAGTIILLTSLISGTFYVVHHTTPLLARLVALLPQTSLMQLAHSLEQGQPASALLGPIIHIIVTAAALGLGGWLICRQRFRRGKYS